MGKSMNLSTIPRTNTRRTNMNMIPTNTSLNTVTKRTNMTTSTTTTSTAMRMMITNLTMATRRIRTATITVTRRIPTVKITMVINNPMEDTVKSNLMVIKATVMVMATNNTEDMDVNLTDTVTNLPMVTDTNL